MNIQERIYTSKNIGKLKEVKVLDDGQIYIYVMLNTQNRIKIGQTTNIQQRLASLSGSNGAGEKIITLYCSPSTYVKSMEKAIHDHFHKYRIDGTEWFDDLDFTEVVEHINGLFYTKHYIVCNNERKKIIEKMKRESNENLNTES